MLLLLALAGCAADPAASEGPAELAPVADSGQQTTPPPSSDAATTPARDASTPTSRDAASPVPVEDASSAPLDASLSPGACPTGQKRCGGLCTDPHPSIGCGLSDCEPCPGAGSPEVQCEAGACVGVTGQAIDDVPATEGCPDPLDPATQLPPSPETGASCGDPLQPPDGELARPCCFYRCFRGHHYYFCSPPTGNFSGWDRARDRCRASGMKLVQIDNYRENDFVVLTGLPHYLTPIWTGLNDQADPAVWRWVTVAGDDGPVLYRDNALTPADAFTAVSPPQAAVLSSCVGCAMLISGTNNEWEPQDLTSGAYPYVCESE
jgi:hypothetical protein